MLLSTSSNQVLGWIWEAYCEGETEAFNADGEEGWQGKHLDH